MGKRLMAFLPLAASRTQPTKMAGFSGLPRERNGGGVSLGGRNRFVSFRSGGPVGFAPFWPFETFQGEMKRNGASVLRTKRRCGLFACKARAAYCPRWSDRQGTP
jgi:hypothetical protein